MSGNGCDMDNMGEYRAYLKRQGCSRETISAYTETIDRLERFAGKPIEAVTPDEAAAWLGQRRLSPATRNAYHRWLTRWANWAESDLLADVNRARAQSAGPRPLTPARVDVMLAGCRSDEETALILLGVTVGWRRAEIARFRGDDLDPWDQLVQVWGKGDKPARVPATASLVRHARVMPPVGYWFPSPVNPGRPVAPSTIGARVRVIAERSGAGSVTTHRLRHTYATELVHGGVPLTTVQRLMRHSKIGTTAMYVGVEDDDLREAVTHLPWAA